MLGGNYIRYVYFFSLENWQLHVSIFYQDKLLKHFPNFSYDIFLIIFNVECVQWNIWNVSEIYRCQCSSFTIQFDFDTGWKSNNHKNKSC